MAPTLLLLSLLTTTNLIIATNHVDQSCGSAVAYFDDYHGVKGYVRVQNGGYVEIKIDVSDLDASTCSDNGAKFIYHIHEEWNYDENTDKHGATDCGADFTAGHFNPYDKPFCAAVDYINYFSCEVGDLSGRFGPAYPDYGKIDITGTVASYGNCKNALNPETLYGKSIVFHCSDGARLFCAPFELHEPVGNTDESEYNNGNNGYGSVSSESYDASSSSQNSGYRSNAHKGKKSKGYQSKSSGSSDSSDSYGGDSSSDSSDSYDDSSSHNNGNNKHRNNGNNDNNNENKGNNGYNNSNNRYYNFNNNSNNNDDSSNNNKGYNNNRSNNGNNVYNNGNNRINNGYESSSESYESSESYDESSSHNNGNNGNDRNNNGNHGYNNNNNNNK